MNLLDIVLLLLVVAAAVGGYRLGFLARSVSWLGLLAGLLVAGRLLPVVVGLIDDADEMTAFVVAATFLAVGAFAGQALGLLVGGRARRSLPEGPVATADKAAGAGAGAVGILLVLWLLLPALAELDSWPADQAETSAVRRALDSALPAPPDAMSALRSVTGGESFPRVFDPAGPRVEGPPPATSGLAPALAEQVRASVVRVEGSACGRIQDGTGFVIGPELVVTNAHVVAGVERADVLAGEIHEATVVGFDPERDLALLAVPGLDAPAVVLGKAVPDVIGGVFGHPGGGDLEVSPARVEAVAPAEGRDLYDRVTTRREVLFLAADLAPGDSGGPLVDDDGEVIGVAFAVAPDRRGVAYALSSGEVSQFLGEVDPTTAAPPTSCVIS